MKVAKTLKADLALILITVIWAATFTVVKSCLDQASPVLFLAIRFWIATIALLLFIPKSLRGISRRTFSRGTFIAIVFSAGYILQTIGLRGTTPSRCAFITSLYVLAVPLLGFLLLRHRPGVRTMMGVLVATIGLGLLTLNPQDLSVSPGDLLTLAGAVAFALQILFIGQFLPSTDFRQLVLFQIVGTAIFCTFAVPVLEKPFIVLNSKVIISLLLLGIFATALTTLIQNSAQRYTTANRAALLFSIEPFFANLIAYWALGDKLTAREWIGGVLVLIGILISEIRKT